MKKISISFVFILLICALLLSACEVYKGAEDTQVSPTILEANKVRTPPPSSEYTLEPTSTPAPTPVITTDMTYANEVIEDLYRKIY